MAQVYHYESRLRSFLKGLSWRGVAMLDTFVVALLVTWWILGTPQFEESGWIMLIETPLKLLIYYAHERIWQFAWRDHQVSNKDILLKTISWRVFATTMTFLIAYFIFNSSQNVSVANSDKMAKVALVISITELVTKSVLYFIHEKLWLKVRLGQVRRMYNQLKERIS